MSGYTPGPWDYDQDDLAIWINATAAGYPEPIAKMGKSVRLPQYANARLISAAPNLYEALNYIVGWMEGAEGDRNLLLDDAYNALAKAEGEIDA